MHFLVVLKVTQAVQLLIFARLILLRYDAPDIHSIPLYLKSDSICKKNYYSRLALLG